MIPRSLKNEKYIKVLKYNFNLGYQLLRDELNDEELKDLMTEFIICDFFSKGYIAEDIRYYYGTISLELVNFGYVDNSLQIYVAGDRGDLPLYQKKTNNMEQSGKVIFEAFNANIDFYKKLYSFIKANVSLPLEDEIFIHEVDSLPF